MAQQNLEILQRLLEEEEARRKAALAALGLKLDKVHMGKNVQVGCWLLVVHSCWRSVRCTACGSLSVRLPFGQHALLKILIF